MFFHCKNQNTFVFVYFRTTASVVMDVSHAKNRYRGTLCRAPLFCAIWFLINNFRFQAKRKNLLVSQRCCCFFFMPAIIRPGGSVGTYGVSIVTPSIRQRWAVLLARFRSHRRFFKRSGKNYRP